MYGRRKPGNQPWRPCGFVAANIGYKSMISIRRTKSWSAYSSCYVVGRAKETYLIDLLRDDDFLDHTPKKEADPDDNPNVPTSYGNTKQ